MVLRHVEEGHRHHRHDLPLSASPGRSTTTGSAGMRPNASRAEVVEKILHLRQRYHFGPSKVAMYLNRYRDMTISTSRMWRILKRLEIDRLPASQRYPRRDPRWKRREQRRPGRRVQIGVTFVEPPEDPVGLPAEQGRTRRPPSGSSATSCAATLSLSTIQTDNGGVPPARAGQGIQRVHF
jgi:hypothetical protein